MVLILCLNSAIDKTLVVPGFATGRLFRPSRSVALAGGKGINVARVLKALRIPAKVIGVRAGSTGDWIQAATAAEGIAAEWVVARRGESRTCLAVLNGPGTPPTEINEHGPTLSPDEVAAVERRVKALLARSSLLVLSGSLPNGVPAGFYARLIGAARRAGVPTALDTSGPALARALAAGPTLVKINDEEAASIGLRTRTASDRRNSLLRLLGQGASAAVVTLGERGAVGAAGPGSPFAGATRFASAAPLRLKAVCAVGSGDTFLAGLVAAWRRGWPLERALRAASSMAAANTLSLGAGRFPAAVARRLEGRVRVRASV